MMSWVIDGNYERVPNGAQENKTTRRQWHTLWKLVNEDESEWKTITNESNNGREERGEWQRAGYRRIWGSILKDWEEAEGRKDRGESHMPKQKRAETAFILSNTCGPNATQRFFCRCTTWQRFTPMRKAVVTSSQLTGFLSGEDKGLESSCWSRAFWGRRSCCVWVFVFSGHCVPQQVCLLVGTSLALFMLYGLHTV